MVLTFATNAERNRFLRLMRLFVDDVSELSACLSILIALSHRSQDDQLRTALDRNGSFWNSILASLYTSSFVIMGRIHDRAGCLPKLKRTLARYKSMASVSTTFEQLERNHQSFLDQVLRQRNRVFAHTDIDRPLLIAFGFHDLTWAAVEKYWLDLAHATKLLGNHRIRR
jgi:AbiU2